MLCDLFVQDEKRKKEKKPGNVYVCVCVFNSLLNKLDHMRALFLIYHAEICFYFCL